MAKTKKASVSKAKGTKQDAARFDRSRQPGPEYVWHDSFDYVHKGLTIRVRGHWEKSPHIVKEKVKPKRSSKTGPHGLLELAKANTPQPVPIKKEKANSEAKAGEGGA
jgi:hypothetical protein